MTFKVYTIYIIIIIIYKKIYNIRNPANIQTNRRKSVYITKPSKIMLFRTYGLERRE